MSCVCAVCWSLYTARPHLFGVGSVSFLSSSPSSFPAGHGSWDLTHRATSLVRSCPFISLIVALGQHLICPSLPAQVGHRECYTCRGLRASPGEHGPKMGLTCLHPARAVGTSPAGWASFPAALYGNMTTERTHALWSAASLWPALV